MRSKQRLDFAAQVGPILEDVVEKVPARRGIERGRVRERGLDPREIVGARE